VEGSTILAWIAIFGILTGFRTFLPLAVMTLYVWRQALPMPPHLQFLGHLPFVVLACLLALGELCADKWKGMPNRTAPLGLLGRFSLGAIGGGVLATSVVYPWWKGSLTGAVLALFGAALGFSLRQYFKDATRAPDMYIALAEDLITLVGACWVLDHLA
jgi:uncharacterized membrane protein